MIFFKFLKLKYYIKMIKNSIQVETLKRNKKL